MTDHEKDRIIAEMVRERREVRTTIACLEERLHKARDGFEVVLSALREYQSVSGSRPIHLSERTTYPDVDTFRTLIRDLAAAKVRLQEIESRLDQC